MSDESLRDEELREKYSNYAFARDISLQQSAHFDPMLFEQLTPASIAASQLSSNANNSSELSGCLSLQAPLPITVQSSKLDSMIICSICKGLGILKVEYNYYVRDKTCDTCNGEGTVIIDNTAVRPESKDNNDAVSDKKMGEEDWTRERDGVLHDDDDEIPNLEVG